MKGTLIPTVSPENQRMVTDEFGVMKTEGLIVTVSPYLPLELGLKLSPPPAYLF